MLLLDYYISPDYNNLLNIRHSLLIWCKSKSFLLKHQSKTLQHTEKNININIAHVITMQKYFRRQFINAFPIGEDFSYLCTRNSSPFKGLQLQQGIAPPGFYTLQQCCQASVVENQQTSLSPWAFLCHIMDGWGKPFFFPGSSPWDRR